MKHVTRIIALLAIGTFLTGARATAAQAGKNANQYAALDAQLMELDKDHDGRLDHGEIRGALRAVKKLNDPRILALVDTNKDGKIDKGELKKYLDTDQDGKIDHGEARRFLIMIKTQFPDLYAKVVATDVPIAHGAKHNKNNG